MFALFITTLILQAVIWLVESGLTAWIQVKLVATTMSTLTSTCQSLIFMPFRLQERHAFVEEWMSKVYV